MREKERERGRERRGLKRGKKGKKGRRNKLKKKKQFFIQLVYMRKLIYFSKNFKQNKGEEIKKRKKPCHTRTLCSLRRTCLGKAAGIQEMTDTVNDLEREREREREREERKEVGRERGCERRKKKKLEYL